MFVSAPGMVTAAPASSTRVPAKSYAKRPVTLQLNISTFRSENSGVQPGVPQARTRPPMYHSYLYASLVGHAPSPRGQCPGSTELIGQCPAFESCSRDLALAALVPETGVAHG